MKICCQSVREIEWLAYDDYESTRGEGIDVWTGKVDHKKLNDAILVYLNEAELLRMEKLKSLPDKILFANGRSSLKFILSKYLNCHPLELHFRYTRKGKPFLPDFPDVPFFNLSHSGTWFSIVLGQESCGIDVEKIDKLFDFQEVTKLYFSHQEHEHLQTLNENDSTELFYTWWTRKEAILKERGIGLSKEMKYIQVIDGVNQFKSNDHSVFSEVTKNYQIYSFHLDEFHIASTAILGFEKPVRYFRHRP